ncbi:hypothetical protein FIM10_15710 [Sphingomonadales bacterium 56]|jgi:hypothetical protein|uniref:hypothetical protein n=1 Tax=Sphingomonadales TaxID=204457 RepID=UPI000BE3F72C|nr:MULTISPECIES: hypothetical protein [Sphingomonadaceae]MBY2930123.1 hypothetical protein [Sphingomonadales bacterium 56]MBY2960189.1 hypothetical protein [Sphingomonadales bacterium 58]CAD7340582.1 hypothetical protein SPHS8_03167 [Sphingobium sp. S8]CAD7340795.1 hypothetical protein SPHS6_03167 [Sphingobium sp. S6]
MPAIGWKLDEAERSSLLDRFPPLWPDVIADHITLASGVPQDAPLPEPQQAEIVGSISDGEGLQALIVVVGGNSGRPDGGTFHITWSLDRSRGREAVQSNDVIADLGWRRLPEPVPIRTIPARF